MQVVNIGELDGNAYNCVELQPSRNPINHGKYFYFKNRIILRQQQPTTNYGVIPGTNGERSKLAINDPLLKAELQLLIESINRSENEGFNFKNSANDRVYIKINNFISPPPLNHEIMYCVSVFAVFVQSCTRQAFLQMEVTEVAYKPICLLATTWPTFNPAAADAAVAPPPPPPSPVDAVTSNNSAANFDKGLDESTQW